MSTDGIPRGEPDLDPASILRAAQGQLDTMVAKLLALVKIETPSTEPDTMEPAFVQLQCLLAGVGLECERIPGKGSGGMLLAGPPEGDPRPRQLLIGHCDTVWPVGTLASMPAVVENGRLKGPGSFDMKAGLIQTAFALRLLHDAGVTTPVAPVVLVNSDEEVGSFDSADTIERLARQSDRCFVMEPSLAPDGRLKTRRKGVAQFEVRVRGRSAHAGLNPEEGVSAVLEMARQVERLFALNDPARGVTVNVGVIEGGSRPNVIAPDCRALVDVRAPTVAAAAEIEATLRSLPSTRSDVQVSVTRTQGRPPLDPGADARRLWGAARRLASDMGFELGEGMAGGGSDGNQTNLHTPTLDGLGAVGDGAHSDHEHVLIEAMPQRCALLALLLAQPPTAELPAFPAA